MSVLLLGLPLLGAWSAGKSVGGYLEFPPRPDAVPETEFLWPVFLAYGLLEVPLYGGLLYLVWPRRHGSGSIGRKFPNWGWMALAWTCGAWFLAWARPAWAGGLLNHTFTMLWLGYIGVVNAFCYWRCGRSLLTHHWQYLLGLFPLSALFWWYFEYLNRFAGNWQYLGIESLTPWQYFVRATLPFSTVLPAVISTLTLLRGLQLASDLRLDTLRIGNPRRWAWQALILSGAGLFALGRWPQFFFPLLWIAPLAIFIALQVLRGEATCLEVLVKGNWQPVVLAAMAALVCGFFWEMWNYWSDPKWVYVIPYVGRFKLFEMPILGYAGYLPFGLECWVVADWWARLTAGGRSDLLQLVSWNDLPKAS